MTKTVANKIQKQFALLGASLVAFIYAFSLFVPVANADVRKADIIYGESVESRDLSVANCPSIEAQYAILMTEDGTVYFERDAYESTQIASITKIMTAIVALDSGVDLSTQITVSETAATIGESTSDLQTGDVLTLDQALTAMLVSSGNDAAQAIAENIGSTFVEGSESSYDAFVNQMNKKASELGMTNSLFENPHGLDFDSYAGELHSSAYDVAIMAKYAMQNETFRNIVSQSSATITLKRDGVTTQLELESTDEMLDEYDGACGIKTGFTALAGASFCGACERDGKLLIAVVINSSDESNRFYDCENLFDWYFEHVVSYNTVNTSEYVDMETTDGTESVPVIAEVAHSAWIDKTIKLTISADDTSTEIFDLNGNVSQYIELNEVSEDVHAGDVLGTITFKQRNVAIGTYNLIAAEDCAAPNLFEGIGIWFNRFMLSFSGDDGVAENVIYNETPLVNDKSSIL